MEQDIAEFLRSYYYYLQNGSADNINTVGQLTSADAQARYAALIQTGVLEAAFEESTVQQLHEAQRTGWYMNLGAAGDIHKVVDLVEEALAKQMEKDPTGGMRYEYQRLLQVMNVIEEMALKAAVSKGDTSQETSQNIAKAVLGMAANPKARRKMRESAKVVDIILHSNADEEQKLNMSAAVFREVADPSVTVQEFVTKNKGRMYELGKDIVEPIPANIYLLAGKELIVIESTGEVITRSIESSLRGLTTEFGVSDPVALLTRLSEALYTKGNYNHYQLEDGKLISRSSGIRLPTPEHFEELLVREVLAHVDYIKQLTDFGYATVKVFEVFKSFPDVDTREVLCTLAGVETSEVNEMLIKEAIHELFPLPPILQEVLTDLACEIELSLWEPNKIVINMLVQKGDNYESIPNGSKVQE
jgi:uncharacterized protein YlzI (FlbEa/FlbD family)